MKSPLLLVLLIPCAVSAQPKHGPECGGWAAKMAAMTLDGQDGFNAKDVYTPVTKALRLSSEPVKKGFYQQVYDITFQLRSGGQLHVITHGQATDEECSGSSVDVYVVSTYLHGSN